MVVCSWFLTCLKMHTVPLGAVLNREAVGNLVKKRNIARRLLGLGESELNMRKQKQFGSRKLERIQERALRAIFNRKSGTYDELLKLAKLPTLKNRRLQDIAVLMYKVKNELCPSYINPLPPKSAKWHTTS